MKAELPAIPLWNCSSSNLLGRNPRTVEASGLSPPALCWLVPNCSGSKDCPKQPSPFLCAAHAKKTNQSYPPLFLSNREIKSFSPKWLFRAVAILEKPFFFFLMLQPFSIRKRWIPLSPLASKSSLVLAALWLVAELSSSKERKRESRDHKVPKHQRRKWLCGGITMLKDKTKPIGNAIWIKLNSEIWMQVRVFPWNGSRKKVLLCVQQNTPSSQKAAVCFQALDTKQRK